MVCLGLVQAAVLPSKFAMFGGKKLNRETCGHPVILEQMLRKPARNEVRLRTRFAKDNAKGSQGGPA